METKRKTEIVLIGNEKGGTAKTTTVLCLANALTAYGYKVLVVDLDPSGNFSDAALPNFPEKVLYDVMNGQCYVNEAIVHTEICDVLPTVKDLTPEEDSPFMGAGMANRKSLGQLFSSWVGRRGAEKCIYNLLRNPGYEPVFGQYDFILLDSQPSDSLIITNAIVAADSIIFPCEPASGALDGLTKFKKSIQLTRDSYGTNAYIDGLVFAKYNEDWKTRQKLAAQIQEVAEADGIPVYKTRFRLSASIETAMNDCQPVLHPDYLYMGWGAYDALNFALEFLAKRGLAPKVNYPGVVKDEYGNLVYRRKGDKYYSLSSNEDGCVLVASPLFRVDEVSQLEGAVGKTVFFHLESILRIFESAKTQSICLKWETQKLEDLVSAHALKT